MAEPAMKPEESLARLTELARDAGRGEASARVDARGRERLIARIDAGAVQRRGLPARTWSSAALALAVAAAVAFFFLRQPKALTFALTGAALEGSSYVRAFDHEAVASFSEGTIVGFHPGARGRIDQVTAKGARVRVEEGTTSFDVTHLAGAAWFVDAGPYTITVTGTAFDVTFHEERLEVTMRAGNVIVQGPLAKEGVALARGQRLVADEKRGELVIREVTAEVAEAPKPTAAPVVVADAPSAMASSAVVAPPPIASSVAAPSWRSRIAAGDFAGVLAEAEGRGLDTVIDSGSLADIAALADAARYAGRGELAHRALVAERTRFASSAEARQAAFLLGRMDEGRSPASAVTWYDRYLAESPHGSLAGEALGRKMLAVKASSGKDAAKPIAEQVLQGSPEGPFAPAAREILGAP